MSPYLRQPNFWLLLFLIVLYANYTGAQTLPEAVKAKVDFKTEIQPLLAEKCYSCHGPETQENDLRWDSKSSALKGGVSGPVIIPGKSAESKMVRMVSGLETPVMPKRGERLTPRQISLLRGWIDQGAEWPDDETEKPKDKSDWWSFRPASKPAIPKVENQEWSRNNVDRFILAKLEQTDLVPSPEASRTTLIRRLTFDLHGLPPTAQEVEAFASDPDPEAYEKLVDRLLASPRYGERWARHWLDTVHFAETHGYEKDKPRLNAWHYRDYVIRALNEDKPYSRFIEEQLAGDVLYSDSPDGIAALGFISAGPWDFVGHVELPIEKTDGLIARYNDRDDMVMATMSTFQSLTVHCARCHNHKFDPISQKDYYALQTVFAGVDRADRDFDPDATVHRQRQALLREEKELNAVKKKIQEEIASHRNAALDNVDSELANANSALSKLVNTTTEDKSPSNGYHSGIEKEPRSEKWVQVDLGESHIIQQIRLVPARPVDFKDTPGFGFPPRFTIEISAVADFRNSEILTDLTAGDFEVPGDEPFVVHVNSQSARYIRVTAKKLWERTDDYVFALAELQAFSKGTNVAYEAEVSAMDSIEGGLWSKKYLVDGYSSRGKLHNVLLSEDPVARKAQLTKRVRTLEEKRAKIVDSLLPHATKTHFSETTNRLALIAQELAKLPAPQKIYVATQRFQPNSNFIPASVPRPVHLLMRGDVKRPGEEMKPAALPSVPGPNANFEISDPQNEGLRRAALARWITDPKNMLTRRSIVNRVWHYHFGRGLVETPNDFGHMGAVPSHPELLDYLAFEFLENGESLKKLHRLIVTSATYRQSSQPSAPNERALAVDADNRLLWRMNRTRLDAESMRDSMLAISGQLDFTMGGPSIQQFAFKDDHSPVYDYAKYDSSSAGANRRSIYRFLVRSVPDPLMETLDCPDASILSPVRNTTLTALQALAVFNDPLVLKQAEHFAARLQTLEPDPSKQLSLAYSFALNRYPTLSEAAEMTAFVQKHGMANLCRVIFNSSEFMFVD